MRICRGAKPCAHAASLRVYIKTGDFVYLGAKLVIKNILIGYAAKIDRREIMINPDIFNDVPIFALLDAEERQVLAGQVSVKNFAEGETIFKSGDGGGYAYIVQYGRINISITDIADETIIVDVVEDGGIFGMSSLLASAPHL